MRAGPSAAVALAALGVVLLAGCAGSAPWIAPAPAASAAPAASTPPGQVRITGAVDRPSTLSVAALAAMPSQMVAVEFGTDKGTERHTYLGAPLVGLIDGAGPALTPGTKHDELSLGVLVVGADGYRTLLSYGELSPSFGNTGVLLATSQDGKPLSRPRLVAPHDVKGGRYVSDVVEIDVIHPPSAR
jgi:DMSO/TMAO reductase YedYZ molybdopterin-dependent catalytic subunit